jgi:hypothetical protein
MPPESAFPPELIAPCGLNCSLCRAYLRKNKKCSGCRGSPKNKSNSCLKCKIKNCKELKKGIRFCFSCAAYPCTNLEQLALRYQTRYSINLHQNLKNIKDNGLDNFVLDELKRWICLKCGAVICMHKGFCSACEEKTLNKK